jgi:cell shape-determining protein MreC
MRVQVILNKQRVLVIMVLFSAALIAMGERVGSYVRTPAQLLVAPVGEATMYVVAGIKSHAGQSDRPLTRDEAKVLAQQQLALANIMQVQLEEYRQLRQDMERFNTVTISPLFGPVRNVTVSLVPARVLAEDSLPYGASLVVRPGRKAGAEKGQGVVAVRQLVTDRQKAITDTLPVLIPPQDFVSEGAQRLSEAVLVGRLGRTSAFSAQMHLVIDRQFKTVACVRRMINEVPPRRVMVEGHEESLTSGNNAMILVTAQGNGVELEAQVAAEHNVRKDDWLVLPVDRSYWPAEVLIGMVSRVEGSTTGFHKVYVRPAVDLSSLRNVYILVPQSGAPGPGEEGR